MKYSQNEGKVSDISICNAFVSECSLVLQTEVLEQHRLRCDPLPGDAPGFPSSVWPECPAAGALSSLSPPLPVARQRVCDCFMSRKQSVFIPLASVFVL